MSPLRTQFIGLLTLRGYAQRTHESYVRAVAALSRHYGLPPDQLNDGQIRDYLMGLHREGLSRSTINVAISALRLFYRVMLKRPVERIEECLPRPRKVTPRPRVYSREELRELFTTGYDRLPAAGPLLPCRIHAAARAECAHRAEPPCVAHAAL